MTVYNTDGSHMWPPRNSDPRIQGLLTETGTISTGNIATDIRAALLFQLGLSANHNGYSLDDLWHRWLTQEEFSPYPGEPFSPDIGRGTPQPAFANVVFLCHCDVEPFIDASNSSHTIADSVSLETTEVQFGAGSANVGQVKNTNFSLQVADNNDWNFGSGDFMIELWYNITVLPSTEVPETQVMVANDEPDDRSWHFALSTTDEMSFVYSTDGTTKTIVSTSGLSAFNTGQWYHLAVSRQNNVIRLFRDGTKVLESDEGAQTYHDPTSNRMDVGHLNWLGFTSECVGYIDDVRIVKGEAVYISDFSRPPIAHPDS